MLHLPLPHWVPGFIVENHLQFFWAWVFFFVWLGVGYLIMAKLAADYDCQVTDFKTGVILIIAGALTLFFGFYAVLLIGAAVIFFWLWAAINKVRRFFAQGKKDNL